MKKNLVFKQLGSGINFCDSKGIRCFLISLVVSALVLTTSWHYTLAATIVTVDTNTTFQTIDGFGVAEHVFDNPHLFNNYDPATGRALTTMTTAQQDVILDLLFKNIGLTRIQPTTGSSLEPINDNTDPNVTDLSKFKFTYTTDAHVNIVKRIIARGASTYFISPTYRESWMGVTTANDAAEYTEWLMTAVRRWRALGLEMPYISVVGEPGYWRNTMSGEFIRDVIKLMGPKLRAEGFQTKFVVPDDLNATQAYSRAPIILADPIARSYIAALSFHLYDEPFSNVSKMKSLGHTYGLPLWMTEYSAGANPLRGDAFDWAALMHELISTYNVSAIDYLWGFFGQWVGTTQTLITLNNSGATYLGYTINKPYYTMGQYSKFIKPGARRVSVTPASSTAQVSAFKNPDGSLVIVAVNNTAVHTMLQFNIIGGNGITEFKHTRTSLTENMASLPLVSLSGTSFTINLPAQSVSTFSSASNTIPLPPPPPPSSTDTAPPTTPTNLKANTVSSSRINLIWVSSTDNVGVTGYKIYRNGNLSATSTVTSHSDNGLAPSTTYIYAVSAFDAAGNTSPLSSSVSGTTLPSAPSDTTPPNVSITNPLNGAIVPRDKTVKIIASASDNVGVTKVQFFVNDSSKCTDSTAPYECAWKVPKNRGVTYILKAKAFDAAGNTQSQSISVISSH